MNKLYDILNNVNLYSNVKDSANFIYNDTMNWLKNGGWETTLMVGGFLLGCAFIMEKEKERLEKEGYSRKYKKRAFYKVGR